MTIDPEIRLFVENLLDDWEADEDFIVRERGTSEDAARVTRRVAVRRERWARLVGGDES